MKLYNMLLLLSAALLTSVAAADNFSDCATQMSTLENALYQSGDNIFQLNRIFYPPSMRTTRFITVTYTFLDQLGEEGGDGCNVTYIWAVGGFLFFQPPSLFEFNSLFFNYPDNNLTNVDLQLPHECRPLVQLNDSDVCSCTLNSERLEILTQQVSVHAYTAYNVQSRLHIF